MMKLSNTVHNMLLFGIYWSNVIKMSEINQDDVSSKVTTYSKTTVLRHTHYNDIKKCRKIKKIFRDSFVMKSTFWI